MSCNVYECFGYFGGPLRSFGVLWVPLGQFGGFVRVLLRSHEGTFGTLRLRWLLIDLKSLSGVFC